MAATLAVATLGVFAVAPNIFGGSIDTVEADNESPLKRHGSKVIPLGPASDGASGTIPDVNNNKTKMQDAHGLRFVMPKGKDVTHIELAIIAPGADLYYPYEIEGGYDDDHARRPSGLSGGWKPDGDGGWEWVEAKPASASWKKVECQELVQSMLGGNGSQGPIGTIQTAAVGAEYVDYWIPSYLRDNLFGSGCILAVGMVAHDSNGPVSMYNPRLRGSGETPNGDTWTYRSGGKRVIKVNNGAPVYDSGHQLMIQAEEAMPYGPNSQTHCHPGARCNYPDVADMVDQDKDAVLLETRTVFLRK